MADTERNNNMKKPYYAHWLTADPFKRIVVLVVGDYKASFKELDNRFYEGFLPPEKRTPDRSGIDEILSDSPITGNPEGCGRTFYRKKSGDVFIWFPDFPSPGTLAHELTHAKDYILEDAGVADKEGEVDAYLVGMMYDHFFSKLEEDKKPRKRKTKRTPLSGNSAGKTNKEQTMKKQTKKPAKSAAKKPCASCKAKGKCKK